MQIGDTVTWQERIQHSSSGKAVRYLTGVIVGERIRPDGRKFRVAIEFISGNMPAKVQLLVWVAEATLLCGRTSPSQHVSKVTPQALIARRCGNAIRAAIAVEKGKNERLRLALNRAGIRL